MASEKTVKVQNRKNNKKNTIGGTGWGVHADSGGPKTKIAGASGGQGCPEKDFRGSEVASLDCGRVLEDLFTVGVPSRIFVRKKIFEKVRAQKV